MSHHIKFVIWKSNNCLCLILPSRVVQRQQPTTIHVLRIYLILNISQIYHSNKYTTCYIKESRWKVKDLMQKNYTYINIKYAYTTNKCIHTHIHSIQHWRCHLMYTQLKHCVGGIVYIMYILASCIYALKDKLSDVNTFEEKALAWILQKSKSILQRRV